MKEYGMMLVGTGAGMNVVDAALAMGLKVAIVEEGPIGGTCLNRGCIPSKILIHCADAIREAESAGDIGVHMRLDSVDYPFIKKRMWDLVLGDRHGMEEAIRQDESITLYPVIGSFVSDYTMQVGEETIRAPKIVLASGARATIPPIPGLESVKYRTYRTIFDLEEKPNSIIILGGGYIGCEFAHFFSAIGTRVVLVGHNKVLLPHEEPETSQAVMARMSKLVDLHVGTDATRVEGKPGGIAVTIKDPVAGEKVLEGEQLLVATGVRSNSDWLRTDQTGVNTDVNGWIVTNQYLETSKPNIWAFGDALGKFMYRHTANYEASVVRNNIFGEQKVMVDLHAVPHAVFTYPQVGAVGMTEQEAVQGRKVMVGFSKFTETAMGYAYNDQDAFVKVVVEYPSRKILGATVVGPQASILVQEFTNMMSSDTQTYAPLVRAQVIHPTLSECLVNALGRLRAVNFEPPEHHHHEH